MTNYAIIVAGGKGSRMQSDTPKQFLLLDGRPVLMHTIEAFAKSAYRPEIILVLNRDLFDAWAELCCSYSFPIPHRIVSGGSERFHSVKNAVNLIEGEGLIAIHDAVRPCVSVSLIDSVYRLAETGGTAVAAVKSRDSVRQSQGEASVSLDRNHIYLVQTPQTFRSDLLKAAYRCEYQRTFTDDASVVEFSGIPINLAEGELSNIKITFPEDIVLAEHYLKKKSP